MVELTAYPFFRFFMKYAAYMRKGWREGGKSFNSLHVVVVQFDFSITNTDGILINERAE